MNHRPTIAIAVHDGWFGCGTGAGHANYGFLETLTGLVPPDLRLVVLPVYLGVSSGERHPGWHERAMKLARAARIDVLPVNNPRGRRSVRLGADHGSAESTMSSTVPDVYLAGHYV